MQGSGDKLAGQKREREAEAPEEVRQGEGGKQGRPSRALRNTTRPRQVTWCPLASRLQTLEELTAAPVAAEPKPAEFGGGADLAEEPEPAADMALEPEPEPEAAGTKAERPAPVPEPAPAGGAADQVQDEGIEVEDEPVQEEEEEEEEEEEGKEEASEESEEEASEESEEEARPGAACCGRPALPCPPACRRTPLPPRVPLSVACCPPCACTVPAGGYKSEGTRHLAGWTNFRAAEPDVPDMMVPQEE